MGQEKVRMATSEVVEGRKKQAETESEKYGHRIGDWEFVEKDKYPPRWKGYCLTKNCDATVTVNPAWNGIWLRHYPVRDRCPYVKRK